MSKSMSAVTISDDVSSDVAQAILTRQKDWGGDPRALLNLVRVVHDTLRDLSLRSKSHSLDANTRDPSEKPPQT